MYIAPLSVVALLTIASAIEFESVGPGQCLDGNSNIYSHGSTWSVMSIEDCKVTCNSYDKTYLRGFTFSDTDKICFCNYDKLGGVPYGTLSSTDDVTYFDYYYYEGSGPVKGAEVSGMFVGTTSFCFKVKTPDEYILPDPECSVETADNSSLGNVKCSIKGIESPDNAIVTMTVLAFDDCVTDYKKEKFGGTEVYQMTEDAVGVSDFSADVEVDHTNGFVGVVQFCIRTDLIDNVLNHSMVFKSKKVNMEFIYNGQFYVDNFSATTYNGIDDEATSEVKEFGVSANLCDINGNTIEASLFTLELGEFLYVCIGANEIGVVITSVDEFDAYKAVDEGTVPVDISSYVLSTGFGSPELVASMNLPALFFEDVSPITIVGSVNMGGKPNARRLKNSSEISPESAKFEMVVNVAGDNSSASGYAIMVTAIFGVTPFFMI